MGKILEYNDFNAAPADADLLFFADASNTAANPATFRLKISDLNKKRNVDAATSAGLLLRDDSSTFGIKIHDGGNVGVGPGAATTPAAFLSVRGAADSSLTLANFLNPSATTNGRYQQIIFGTDAASDKSVVFRYYYSTVDDASTLRIQSYEDAAAENEIGLHLKGDGNVGIGETNPAYPLDVKGTVVSNGSYPLILDPSTGEIKSNSTTTLNFNKSANANISFMYFDSDGSTVNPALSIKASNKRVSIGNDSTPDSKLHIKEADQDTNPVIKIENTTSSGHTAIELTRNGADEFITWDGSTLAIAGTNIAASAATVNFQSGKLALGTTTFTRKFNVTDSSNIVSQFVSSSTSGARLVLETGTGNAAATYSSPIAHPIYESSAKKVNWMSGAFRLSSTNYFGIHYSSATFSAASDIAFDGTLANNLFYIDTSGNVTIKGNAAADAFYDKGGTTVGNYCRGRFIQTFSYRYFYTVTSSQRWTPLFSQPVDTATNYDNTGSKTPDKSVCSKAPMAGRVTRLDVSFTNNVSNNGVSAYVYSGADAPAADLSSSNAAYTGSISLSGAITEGDYTIGYNDFVEASRTHLDFAAGEFLMLAIDNATGDASATVVVTVEFDVPDSLGA